MSRIEIDGIYKHAPLTNAQISGTKRNLDREIIIRRDAVTSGLIPTDGASNPTTSQAAHPTSYIFALDYDSTDDGGDNPNIRRNIPTLELLGNTADGVGGSNWIKIQTTPISSYNYLSGGETIQEAVELLDGAAAGAVLQHLIDGPTTGSLTSSEDGATPSSTNTGGDYQIALGEVQTLTNSENSIIASGGSNTIDNSYASFIGGGLLNSITDVSIYSFIGNGYDNSIDKSTHAVIVGGESNYIGESSEESGSTVYSTIVGGNDSEINSPFAFIGGGYTNYIGVRSVYSTISGGSSNYISQQQFAFLGGGQSNQIRAKWDEENTVNVIVGGGNNYIEDAYASFIGGGYGNYIDVNSTTSHYDVIIGGLTNAILGNAVYSSIVGGNENSISGAAFSFIGGGRYNYLEGSSTNVITGGVYNTITNAGPDNVIGGGYNNLINNSGGGSVIAGGINNYIGGVSGRVFIGAGENNRIADGPNHSSIVGGKDNYIGYGGYYSFIGGGETNYIDNGGATYSAILGGRNNVIATSGADIDDMFIIGSGIDTSTITTKTNTTFINNINLWDRGLELRTKTPNPGDVPIVEDTNGDSAVLTWGPPTTSSDPNPGSSFSHFYVSVNGLTVIPDDYISIQNPESTAPTGYNNQFTIGTEKTVNGYNVTDTTLTTLSFIYSNIIPTTPPGIIESEGIKIEDGYEYTLWINSGALGWAGPYLKEPSTTPTDEVPVPDFDYDGRIKVTRIGSTRTVKMGSAATSTITGDYFTSTVDDISYTSNDSIDSTTTGTSGSIAVFLTYNYTTNTVNLGLLNTFMHHSYVAKYATTYDTDASGNVIVNWPTSEYALPSLSDQICFWESDPATNTGIPNVNITNISNPNVTISQTRAASQTGVPCWVFVYGRTPRLAASFTVGVAKAAR